VILALVVDASVGLKWVLEEPDSHLAEALVRIEPDLLIPDFWLQVRRRLFTPDEAREGLTLLRAQIEPTPTAQMQLHEVALDIGLAINHSTYDTLYLAFAIAVGASGVVAADGPFTQSIRTHPDPALSAMVIPLDTWARTQGIGEP
jgi:predicted nucleic acid-binding protein